MPEKEDSDPLSVTSLGQRLKRRFVAVAGRPLGIQDPAERDEIGPELGIDGLVFSDSAAIIGLVIGVVVSLRRRHRRHRGRAESGGEGAPGDELT